jgi:hypothetical protein
MLATLALGAGGAVALYFSPLGYLYGAGLCIVLIIAGWLFGAPSLELQYPPPPPSNQRAGKVAMAASFNPPHLGHMAMLQQLAGEFEGAVAIIAVPDREAPLASGLMCWVLAVQSKQDLRGAAVRQSILPPCLVVSLTCFALESSASLSGLQVSPEQRKLILETLVAELGITNIEVTTPRSPSLSLHHRDPTSPSLSPRH